MGGSISPGGLSPFGRCGRCAHCLCSRFPQPGRREKRLIFQVLTANMNLADDVDLEDYVSRPEKVSGAEIACIVQEAGMQAVRNNRYVVLPKDFEKGYKANTQKNDKDFEFYR